MAYQDEHGERRRVVVETPNERREVVHFEQIRHPQSSGVSGATLAAVVIAVIALAAVMILFVLNRQDTMNNNATAQQPPQTIIQQPAQQPQPPIIVQQPAPATQPAPVIVNNPPTAGGSTSGRVSDDSTIQTAIDKKLSDDPSLASLGITAVVLNGKVTLTGVVKTESQKAQVERTMRSVKGVKSIDNQITVGY